MKKYLILLLCSISTFSQQKKNILFLFADDFAYDCLAAHGNTEVKTPNLDKLSDKSTHFTHAYNSGSWSGAVCAASRTMLISGQQIWNAANLNSKKIQKVNPALESEFTTLDTKQINLTQCADKKLLWPQLIEASGYDTFYTGKWHVQGEGLAKKIWQNTVHIRGGMPKQDKGRYKRTFIKGEKSSWSPSDSTYTNIENRTYLSGYWEGGKHWSEVAADDAISFLKKTKNDTKPFLMTVAFNAPHDPKQAPKKYQDMYPYDGIKLPENFMETYPHNFGANEIRDEKLAPFPRTPYSIQVNRSEYYALITHLDEQIGKILDYLKASGQADNTIIVFTADHGLAQGNHGLMGKQNQYDPSVRVPWIISGPGIPKNKKVNTPIYLQDVAATALEIAGVTKPNYIDFNSVLPLIESTEKPNNLVYGSYMNHQRMVRNSEYKYILYPLTGVELLYNIKNDPLEKKNLSKDKNCLKSLNEMRNNLALKMKEMNDPLDLKNPIESYKLYKFHKKGKIKTH